MKTNKQNESFSLKHHNANLLILATLFLALLTIFTVVSMLYFHTQVSKFSVPSTEASNYSRHYAYIGDNTLANEEIYDAASKEGAATDAYVEFMGSNLDISYSKLELMDIAVNAGVDGIIISGDESEEMTEAIYSANQSGIPVITAGDDCSGSAKVCYVGISNYTLGQEYGKQIVKSINDDVQNILVLMSPSSRSNGQSLIYSGLHDYLSDSNSSRQFKLETMAVGDGTSFSSEEDISDIFSKSSLPDIIVCLDETDTTCACQAIVDYNKVGECTIMGFSSNDTILSAIDKDILAFSLTISSADIGKRSVDSMNEYLSTGFVTQYNTLDIECIDKTNVASYIAKSKEASSDSENS